jgi:hypothetical protein
LNAKGEVEMRGIFKKAALAAVMTIASVQPAQACWDNAGQNAVKIKHLNTMLMVTALRCRGGADNFLPQYNRFVTNNSALIGSQNKLIKAQLAQSSGSKGAEGALDRMSIGFANTYGTGHKSMGCRELKQLAADLSSEQQGVATLTLAADQAVGETRLPGGVCAARIARRP